MSDSGTPATTKPMKLELVVAADEQNGIGVDGDLPWHLPGDMKYFKELTIGDGKNAVIMGRKTWQSIPERFRPLPQRWNLVLSRGELQLPDGVDLAHSLEAALEEIQRQIRDGRDIERVFVIGGGQIYAAALESGLCNRVYLTRVATTLNCDAFLPSLEQWQLLEESPPVEEKGLTYQFQVLEPTP